MKRPFAFLSTVSLSVLLLGVPALQSQPDWFEQMDKQFEETFNQTDAAFDRALTEGIEELDRELANIWGDARRLPEPKKWVGYSTDRKKRVIVDYDAGEISVEGIDLDETDLMGEFQDILLEDENKLNERDKLKEKLLEKTRDYWDDPVIQERRKKAFNRVKRKRPELPEPRDYGNVEPQKRSGEYNLFRNEPRRHELARLVAPKAKPVFVKRSTYNNKGKTIEFGKVTIPMRSDRDRLSAEALIDPINRAVEKYNLPKSLILSVIKNESSFNPRALSPAKAMGLMQLVATSGGKEAYSYLLGREATPGPDVLYDPVENIMLGATYLYLLNTRYFGKIKNPETRRHLIIAAYNTGAGNVAKAFTGAMKLRPAIEKINRMDPDAVYAHLQAHLPYDETKTYLARVSRDLKTFADWDDTA